MKKHRIYLIRKQADCYRRFSIHHLRDDVTGEHTIRITIPGKAWIISSVKIIPELQNSDNVQKGSCNSRKLR